MRGFRHEFELTEEHTADKYEAAEDLAENLGEPWTVITDEKKKKIYLAVKVDDD